MSHLACTVGDKNTENAVVVGPVSPDVIINGKAAALVGSVLTECDHPPRNSPAHPPHVHPTIISGSGSVVCNGKALAITDLSKCSCGHVMATGVGSVQVGN